MRFLNADRSIRALHEASTQPSVVMAANALIDETIPAERADVHAGVVVSLSADKLTGGTHQASWLTSARMVSTRQSNANPSAVLLADFLRLRPEARPETHEAAIDVTGRSVDPATASDIVQMVKVLLRRKALELRGNSGYQGFFAALTPRRRDRSKLRTVA
jgi:hypothetical protein